MSEERKPGWVEGRTRESADGLSRRHPSTPEEQRRLREAAEQAQREQHKTSGKETK